MHSWRTGPIPHQYRIATQLQHAAPVQPGEIDAVTAFAGYGVVS